MNTQFCYQNEVFPCLFDPATAVPFSLCSHFYLRIEPLRNHLRNRSSSRHTRMVRPSILCNSVNKMKYSHVCLTQQLLYFPHFYLRIEPLRNHLRNLSSSRHTRMVRPSFSLVCLTQQMLYFSPSALISI